MMSRASRGSESLLLEFIEDAPVLEPLEWEPTSEDLERLKHHAERMLESEEPWIRRDGRLGLISNCVLRVKRLLSARMNPVNRPAALEALRRLEKLRGRIAEPVELQELVESIVLAVGTDRDRAGGNRESWSERYPDLMDSEFGPLLKQIRELSEETG